MARFKLSPEKHRRLRAAASPAGIFKILAVDHRRVLIKLMDRGGRGDVASQRVTDFKLDVVRAVGPLATAVILDPEYGARQAVACSAVPKGVGLLASVDLEAFTPGAADLRSAVWDVRAAREIGASGVKLYLSYHPDAGAFTVGQEDLVRNVITQCDAEDMPLFLEPVLRAADADMPAKSLEFAKYRRQAAIRTAERLGALGPEVLKLEFPVDCQFERDESVWRAACAELSNASPVPWALLSGGESFEDFTSQLQIACEAGCSGFMAGRTLWGEAAMATDGERHSILSDIGLPRMKALNDIADRDGCDWEEKRRRHATD